MNDDKRKHLEEAFGNAYNASSLGGEIGLLGVRLSPSQYLSSRGIEGALQALLEIIQNAVDESAEMIAFFKENNIDVSQLGEFQLDISIAKNDTIIVSDTGRGVPADFSEKFGRPAVEAAFEEINVGGKGHGYVEDGASAYKGNTIGKHGSGAACANATSDFFYVDTYVMKDKKHYRVEWEKAIKTKPLVEVAESPDRHGTTVHFRPSREVFQLYSEKRGEVNRFFFYDDIKTILTEYAYNTENISFNVKFEKDDETWIDEKIRSDAHKPEERLKPFTRGNTYQAEIVDTKAGYQLKAFIGVASKRTHFITCNMINLKHGTHLAAVGEVLDELKTDIIADINKKLIEKKSPIKSIDERVYNSFNAGTPLTFTSMYLSLFMDDPDYSGQSKDELRSPRIKQSLKDKFREILDTDLTEFKSELVSNISRLTLLQIEREESYRRDEERRKAQAEKRKREKELLKTGDPNAIKGMSAEDKNLTRAREQDLRKVILYMVEGETAKLAMVKARDIQTESIYSIVERPPNVYIHPEEKLWAMKKFKELYKVLYGDKKGDYRAIVLATDGDADGSLIRSLLLALIFKCFPHYLTQGRVFRFKMPKFSASKGEERVFLYTLADRVKHFEETGGTWQYVSYKGIGSIPTQALKQLLQDPDALEPFDPATLKEGMFDLLRFLTDTKYKQEHVMQNYGSNELTLYRQSRKELLKHHEIDFDLDEMDEQFTYIPDLSNVTETTSLERMLIENREENTVEEDMLLDNVLTDDFDDINSAGIDSDFNIED